MSEFFFYVTIYTCMLELISQIKSYVHFKCHANIYTSICQMYWINKITVMSVFFVKF